MSQQKLMGKFDPEKTQGTLHFIREENYGPRTGPVKRTFMQ